MGGKEVILDNNYWQDRAVNEAKLICNAEITYSELEKLSNNFGELYSKGYLEKVASKVLNNFLKDKHLDNYEDPNIEARKLSLMQCIEVFGDHQVVFPSYGTFIPSYEKVLSDSDTDRVHDSLLVGVLNANTITEYEYLMKKIFLLGNNYIMDKNPSMDILHYPRSFVSDILKSVSVANGRFNSFQTNFILGDIPKESQGIFLKKAYEILATNGKLIMVEMRKNIDFDKLENQYFENIKIEEAPFYNKRRELIDMMENKAVPQSISCPEIVLVMATK